MKKALLVLLIVIVVSGLIFSSCAAPNSTATPTSPASAKSPASQLQAPAQKEVKLVFLTTAFGGLGYYFSQAYADLLNKRHPWIRATVVPYKGGIDVLKAYATAKPAERKYMVNWSAWWLYDFARRGVAPYFTSEEAKVTSELRILAKGRRGVFFILTLDPKIKTPEDLKGKKVVFGPKGGGPSEIGLAVMKYCYGIDENSYSPIAMSWNEGKQAVLDGLVQATGAMAGLINGGPETPGGSLVLQVSYKELVDQVPAINAIGISQEQLKKFIDGMGWSTTTCNLKPGAFPKLTQEIDGVMDNTLFSVNKDLEDDVVTELTKFLYENSSLFAMYHYECQALYPPFQGRVGGGESDFHPAAAKFYKANNVRMGEW